VGLLDLVQEDDGVGVLAHGVHQEAAVLEAHIPGRGADEAAHGVLLHGHRPFLDLPRVPCSIRGNDPFPQCVSVKWSLNFSVAIWRKGEAGPA